MRGETLLEEVSRPLSATTSVAFFRSLVPMLGKLPVALLPNYQRSAFTLAVATEQELLAKVQAAIAERLESGELSTGPKAIKAILDAAGVSPRNPRYAEMVWRTNVMAAFNAGTHAQMMEERDFFPCWRYSNPSDSRSRPDHAARDGNYYPTGVTMEEVRGNRPEDAIQCRCIMVPVDKWEWRALRLRGARIAAPYQDVAA